MKLIQKTMLIRKILGFFLLWNIIMIIHFFLLNYLFFYFIQISIMIKIYGLILIYIPFYITTIVILALYLNKFIWPLILILNILTENDWKNININDIW